VSAGVTEFDLCRTANQGYHLSRFILMAALLHDFRRGRGDAARAFSLTELLVVIAIIAVLAGLLLPSLARSKEKAFQTECASNLRQLGFAIQMFADDHGDRLPGPMWQGIYDAYNDESERMPFYLATYLGLPPPSLVVRTAHVAICPAAAVRHRSPPPGTPDDSLTRPVSYLATAEITNVTEVMTRPFGYPYSSPRYRLPKGPDEPPKRTQEIRNPAEAWAITDIDQQNAFPGGLYYELLSANKVHTTRRNQLFFDWHVKAVE
jgi:prepilin-type N-terminal cleavage/methylation domain-containing protein/prepilin-type processing-associated H-X9-DG protein